MSIADHIKTSLQLPGFVSRAYIEDLTDAELMIRPHEKANHIAWQVGHLIASEHNLNNMVAPGSMPALPEGFAEKHDKAKAGSDDPSDFCTKQQYLDLMNAQREGTMALLDGLSDEDLSKPAPEDIQKFGATVGAVVAGQSAHWMMHAGQWVVVRRMLGKEPMF